MNVLVTGGSGFVGGHTAVELLVEGHELVLLDNLSNSRPEAMAAIRAAAGREARFVRGDVRDGALLDVLFETYDFDAVMHFAGVKSVAGSVARPLCCYANNVVGTVRLLERMAAHGVTKLVFSSTAAVYGHCAPVPTDEGARALPVSPYGRSKLAAEEVMRDLCAACPAWRISVLRYFNAVGAHPSGRLGEAPRRASPNLLIAVARVAAGVVPSLTVHGGDYSTRDGTAERDYVHVTDLARGHLAALERLERRPGLSVHNLGSGRSHTVLEFVAAFEAASGATVPVRIGPRRRGDPAVSRADPSKALRELGWCPSRTLEDACADHWRWRARAGRTT